MRASRIAPATRTALGAWCAAAILLIAGTPRAGADATYQPLPFAQDWSNTSLITTNDVWSGVPGIVGYLGSNPGSVAEGVDPRTLVAHDAAAAVVDVNANETSPNLITTGGVTEFHLADPVVAIAGSIIADAPYLVLHVNATGADFVTVTYTLRDLESLSNGFQPMALQYRTTEAGSWTNVTGGYVADASATGAILRTRVSVTLPAAAGNAATLQIRVITTNGIDDEWIGIDDIEVRGVDLAFADVSVAPINLGSVMTGVAWGDPDLDGDLDLAVTAAGTGTSRLFRNDGAGAWADVTPFIVADVNPASGVAFGDADNDGDPDLYVYRNGGPFGRLFRREPGGWSDVTSPVMLGLGGGLAWGDYDADGDLDLFLASHISSPSTVYRNDGGGAWTAIPMPGPAGSVAAVGATAGDVDDDGDLDLYVAYGATAANRLYRNDGNGTWVETTPAALANTGACHGVAFGDYDNDADLDLLVAGQSPNKSELYRNDGGTWVVVAPAVLAATTAHYGPSWADVDHDGDLDFHLTSGTDDKLCLNNGDGTFTDAAPGTPIANPSSGRGQAWGDYDGDGDLDLYVATNGGGAPSKLFRNDTVSGNHWLNLRLLGTVSNRSAIGARVKLYAGGRVRMLEVSGGSGYYSQNSLPLEFGLGASTSIDSLVVRWPSGIVWDTTGVAVDQTMLVVEQVPGVGVGDAPRASELALAIAPNPTARATRIDATLPVAGHVRLVVLDLQGRRVATLADERVGAGARNWRWDGRDAAGRVVRAGVYVVRLEWGSALSRATALRKLVLVH